MMLKIKSLNPLQYLKKNKISRTWQTKIQIPICCLTKILRKKYLIGRFPFSKIRQVMHINCQKQATPPAQQGHGIKDKQVQQVQAIITLNISAINATGLIVPVQRPSRIYENSAFALTMTKVAFVLKKFRSIINEWYNQTWHLIWRGSKKMLKKKIA